MNQKSYYKHYFVHDIEDYFPMYDTLQRDNLFSQYIKLKNYGDVEVQL